MHGKSYYDYEVTLRSWAKRKLKPIPVWENCDNPAFHHGLVFTTNSKVEIVADDVEIMTLQSQEYGRVTKGDLTARYSQSTSAEVLMDDIPF